MKDYIDTVHIGAGSYPSPKEEKEHTIKITCTFEGYVTVFGDDEESWQDQIIAKSFKELTEETDNFEIQYMETL